MRILKSYCHNNKMIRRIKKLIALSKLEEEKPKRKPKRNAVFIGEGTHEDLIEQERKDSGLSGWYRRIRNL